jgi:hypothetical protein
MALTDRLCDMTSPAPQALHLCEPTATAAAAVQGGSSFYKGVCVASVF